MSLGSLWTKDPNLYRTGAFIEPLSIATFTDRLYRLR